MEPLAGIGVRIAGAAAICVAVALLLWNADRRLPRAVAENIDGALRRGIAPSAGQSEDFTAALLAAGIAQARIRGLFAHLLRSALGCLAVAAILWAMATPLLPAGFLSGTDAVARFAGRLVLSGLVTVLLVDWAAAAVTGALAPRMARAGAGGLLGFVLLDLGIRLAALGAVTAATFALYARTAGSFGGSWQSGLRVVPETLAAALRLEGLSGVYVWAALLGGFPLALALLARLAARPAALPVRRALGRLLPIRDRPVRFLGALLGLLAGVGALILSTALGLMRAL